MGIGHSGTDHNAKTGAKINCITPCFRKAKRSCDESVKEETNESPRAKTHADMMTEDIYTAICTDDPAQLQTLLGVDNGHFCPREWDSHQIWPRRSRRLTPLQLAVSEGAAGCVELLISLGVDVDYGGPVCALVTALEHRDPGMTQLLLERGCNVNKRLVRGRLQQPSETCRWNPCGEMFTLPLDVALSDNSVDLIEKLLYYGADPTLTYQLLEATTPLLRVKSCEAALLLLQATGSLSDVLPHLLVRAIHKMVCRRLVKPVELIVEMGLQLSWIRADYCDSLAEYAQTKSLLQETCQILRPLTLMQLCRQAVRTSVWVHYRTCTDKTIPESCLLHFNECFTRTRRSLEPSDDQPHCDTARHSVLAQSWPSASQRRTNFEPTQTVPLDEDEYDEVNAKQIDLCELEQLQQQQLSTCSCRAKHPRSFLSLLKMLPLPCRLLHVVNYQQDLAAYLEAT